MNAAASGLYARPLRDRFGADRMGNSIRQAQRQHLANFLLTFLVVPQLGDPAPVMIEIDGQGVIQSTGEGKRGREKVGQRRVVCTEQRIQRALPIAGCPLCRFAIGAVERHLPAATQQGQR